MSALDSRDATIDFGRAGKHGRIINKLSPFWNAQVQGLDKMARSFIRDPGGTMLKGLLTITLPSMALYALNADEPWYKKLPVWQKNMFWLFSADNGKTIYRVPKPFDWGMLFASLPERLMDQVAHDDPRAFEKWLGSFGTMTIGVDPVELARGDVGSVMASMPLPPVLTSLTAISAGYDPFTKASILPPALQGVKSSAQYTHSTSWFNRKLVEGMENVGLPTISPIEMDYLVRANFGGLGKASLQAVSKVMKTFDPSAPNNPVQFKDFVDRAVFLSAFNVDEHSANTTYSTDFHDALRAASEAERTLSLLERTGNVKEFNRFRHLIPMAMVSKAMRQSAEQAKAITVGIKVLEYDDRLSGDERKRKREQLVDTRDNLYRMSLKAYRIMAKQAKDVEGKMK
ncbi:MAG: hypothetical protein DRJ03_23145 [Chloroflexi bacterium]|nr:MAG: hypothetical protein DRJ03_23145 [Chloroflexota bacterium]